MFCKGRGIPNDPNDVRDGIGDFPYRGNKRSHKVVEYMKLPELQY